jgi:hypothetical protein
VRRRIDLRGNALEGSDQLWHPGLEVGSFHDVLVSTGNLINFCVSHKETFPIDGGRNLTLDAFEENNPAYIRLRPIAAGNGIARIPPIKLA